MAAETSSRLLQAFKNSRILQLGLALTCVLLFAGIFGPSLLVDRGPNQISQSVMAPVSTYTVSSTGSRQSVSPVVHHSGTATTTPWSPTQR